MYIYIFRLMIVDEENENKEKRLICSRTNEALIQKKKKRNLNPHTRKKKKLFLYQPRLNPSKSTFY